mmetsp:Transcript_8451/g.21615  ORF Transcript_8451/g.21615 Transcript_8451/m.21615 type:complete len:398 (+) Transcript_8451:73-1266(+)|eukprot:CAMPEP_0182924986 /NCGR_PEP_ID=MMETSP0105_2-20130417/8067_1 /TAXON_ID=81532 ORGANISM="Acanthoeca-like sp., Strain 10tr" /NCGR_SAMPLE_ID=MMETSP0105_2 /ASSEMBLY_ACC=CAM_ASM_000205 /LENGTH=397 /DNA_ID=CAMNT_0025062815 /DNA_START=56 /DNA_END=1249 /DNA_ORIENTATION=-
MADEQPNANKRPAEEDEATFSSGHPEKKLVVEAPAADAAADGGAVGVAVPVAAGAPAPADAAAPGAAGGAAVAAAAAPQTNVLTETVTVRAICQGKHAGSIIGKGGQTISWIRQQSQAKVNISDQSPVDERVVSATGTAEEIFRAFSFICDKLREAALADQPPPDASAPEVSLRLAIPNTQAGAIIGKAGAKIKEIRDATGAVINMDKEVLPGSTERACSVAGTTVAVSQSIFHIACTMIQVPVRGSNVPYNPGAGAPPAMPYGGYGAPGYGAPRPGAYGAPAPGAYGGYPGYGAPAAGAYGARPPGAYGAAAGQTTQQLAVPNDIAGAIIGRGGAKINEIRTLSQAQVKIAERVPGAVERTITMTGTPEAVQMALYLIQTRMQEATMANAMGQSLP